MKYLLLLFLFGCATPHPYRFTYNFDGFVYTEDLFICGIYPTMLSIVLRSHDAEGCLGEADYYAKTNHLKYDNIECVPYD